MDISMVSVLVSGMTAIVSVVSGVIISKMNNRNQFKLKKLELTHGDKKDAIINYLESISKLKDTILSQADVFDEFKKEYSEWENDYRKKFLSIKLYANGKTKKIINEINEIVSLITNDMRWFDFEFKFFVWQDKQEYFNKRRKEVEDYLEKLIEVSSEELL